MASLLIYLKQQTVLKNGAGRARREFDYVGEEGLEPSIRKRSDILSVVRIPIPPLARYF